MTPLSATISRLQSDWQASSSDPLRCPLSGDGSPLDHERPLAARCRSTRADLWTRTAPRRCRLRHAYIQPVPSSQNVLSFQLSAVTAARGAVEKLASAATGGSVMSRTEHTAVPWRNARRLNLPFRAMAGGCQWRTASPVAEHSGPCGAPGSPSGATVGTRAVRAVEPGVSSHGSGSITGGPVHPLELANIARPANDKRRASVSARGDADPLLMHCCAGSLKGRIQLPDSIRIALAVLARDRAERMFAANALPSASSAFLRSTVR